MCFSSKSFGIYIHIIIGYYTFYTVQYENIFGSSNMTFQAMYSFRYLSVLYSKMYNNLQVFNVLNNSYATRYIAVN